MGQDLGLRYVRVDDALLLPVTSYGLHINLNEPENLAWPNHLAIHKAEVCIEMNGRRVELTYKELARRLGLKEQ